MATLPQVGPRRVPNPTRQIASVDLSAEGRAIEQFGKTAQAAASDFAQKQQQEQDAQAVFAARRQLDDWERSNLYDSENGAAAKLGRDSFDLPDKIPKAYDEFTKKLQEGLAPHSPRARNAVQEMIVSRRDQALGFVDRHVLNQRLVFEEGQYKADIDSSINRVAMLIDAGDLATAAAETKVAQTRAVGFLKSRGRSEEEILAATKDISSKASVATVNLLLDKDKPLEAEKYLRDNAGSMKMEDLLRAKGTVSKAVESARGEQVADEVFIRRVQPAVQPTDFGRLAMLVEKQESGGRPDAVSPKGARGLMQLMPATARELERKLKMKPGQTDADPESNRLAGQTYLEEQLQRFGGDIPKALAAYNAGPGAVQEALKKHGETWLSKMPVETQAYVQKITEKYSSGGGAPAMPTLQEVHQDVRDRIPASQPQLRKIAIAAATQRYEDAVKAKKQGEEEATARGYQWLDQNAGRFSAMPASIRSAIPAKEFDNMLRYGERVAKGDDITDPIMFQRMATDDKWLKDMSDAEFYKHSRRLSQADAQQMALRRGKLLNEKQPDAMKPDNLDTASVNAILNNRLAQMGMDPTPKDESKDAQQVGVIRKFIWDTVLRAQQATGKRLNDAELATLIDREFARNVTFQNTFMGINTSKESVRLLSIKPGDIPGDVRKRLKDDFKAAGISEPTDADLLGAYLQLRVKR